MRSIANQRGVVLVLVLLTMAMIAVAAMGLALSSSVARLSAANHEAGVRLLNAAESALELAARAVSQLPLDAVLSGAVTSELVDGPPGPRTLTSALHIDLDVLTNRLSCGRAAACTVAQVHQVTFERPWGVNNPNWRPFVHTWLPPPVLPTGSAPVYVVVWLGDDAREDDGDATRDGAGPEQHGRYIVRARAEAFGAHGGRRALEAELMQVCTDGSGLACMPGSRVQSWRTTSSLVP